MDDRDGIRNANTEGRQQATTTTNRSNSPPSTSCRMLWEYLLEDDLQNLKIENDIDSIIVVAKSLAAFKTQGVFKIFSHPSSWKICTNHKMLRQLKEQIGIMDFGGGNDGYVKFYDLPIGNNGKMNIFCLVGVTETDNRLIMHQKGEEEGIEGKERLALLKMTIQPAINGLPNTSRSRKFRNETPLLTNSNNQALIVHEHDWSEFARNVNNLMNRFISAVIEGSSRRVVINSVNFYMQLHGQQLTLESAEELLKSVITSPSNRNENYENYEILCQIHKATTIFPGVGKACFLSFRDYLDEDNDQDERFIHHPLVNMNSNKKKYEPYGLVNAGHIAIKGSLPFQEDVEEDHFSCHNLAEQISGSNDCLECHIRNFVAYFQAYDPNIHIMKASHHQENLYDCKDVVFTPYFIFGGYRFCKNFEHTREKVVTHFYRWRQFLKTVACEVPLRIEIVYNLPHSNHEIVKRVIFKHPPHTRRRTIDVCDLIVKGVIKKFMSKRLLIVCSQGWKDYVELAGMEIFANINEELKIVPPSSPAAAANRYRNNSSADQHHLARKKKCTQRVYDCENILIKWTLGVKNNDLYDHVDFDRLKTIGKFLILRRFPLINVRIMHERNDTFHRGAATTVDNYDNVSLHYYNYDISNIIPMTNDEITELECIRVPHVVMRSFASQLWRTQSDSFYNLYYPYEENNSDNSSRNDIERLILNYAIRYSELNNLRVPRDATLALKTTRLQHQQASEYGTRKSTLVGTISVEHVMEDLLCENRRRPSSRRHPKVQGAFAAMDSIDMGELLLSACVERRDDQDFRRELLTFIEKHVEIYCLPEDDPGGKYRRWRSVENERQRREAWQRAYQDVVNKFKISKRLLTQNGLKEEPKEEWQRELVFKLKDNKRNVPIMVITMIYVVLERTQDRIFFRDRLDVESFFAYCRENHTYLQQMEKIGILERVVSGEEGASSDNGAILLRYKLKSTLFEELTRSYERREGENRLRIQRLIGGSSGLLVEDVYGEDQEMINNITMREEDNGSIQMENREENNDHDDDDNNIGEGENEETIERAPPEAEQSKTSSSSKAPSSSSSKTLVLRKRKVVEDENNQERQQQSAKHRQHEKQYFARNNDDGGAGGSGASKSGGSGVLVAIISDHVDGANNDGGRRQILPASLPEAASAVFEEAARRHDRDVFESDDSELEEWAAKD